MTGKSLVQDKIFYLGNDKEMDKVYIYVNKVCIFMYVSRKSLHGGEKFNSRKAVFLFCQYLLKLLTKTRQIQPRLD